MKVLPRHPADLGAEQTVATAALAGATRPKLIQAAVELLLANAQADRVGVWMEPYENQESRRKPVSYWGMVSDHDRQFTPAEWSHLSPEPPLPQELLTQRKTVEQDLDHTSDLLVIGAMIEMRRALWVPIEIKGQLRGVVFGGVRKRQQALARPLFESVAGELALALALEEEECRGRERNVDIEAMRRFLMDMNGRESLDTVLTDLVCGCTGESAAGAGLGATFANIRLTGDLPRTSWSAGDTYPAMPWESEPVARIWRTALATGRACADELGSGGSQGRVSWVVAVPLRSGEEMFGVLVTGWGPEKQGLRSAERLELRAAMAANALARSQDAEEARRREDWKTSLLQDSDNALLLLGAGAEITGMSRGARELMEPLGWKRQVAGASSSGHRQRQHPAAVPKQFLELFRPSERASVGAWFQGATAKRGSNDELAAGPMDAELYNGLRVRAQAVLPQKDGSVAVRLQKQASEDTDAERAPAEAQLLAVIEWLEEGVLVFDSHQGIRAINSRFAQIAGLAPNEVSQVTTLEALIGRLARHAAEPENFAEHWRELSCSDAGTREEIQLLRPVPRVLERAARPVLDPKGRRLGRVEIYRDLTAQRVFQSKLLQTEKLAALGQMLTGVAHELSNPLTSILGYAQRLLLRTGAAGPGEARQIFQEAERATTILRQLLTTARDSRPGRSAVSLNDVIARAVELQRFSLSAERVRLELDLDPALPSVSGDAGQLQQVLMNLMGNARQAIDQTGRGGTMRVRTYTAEDSQVAVDVSDDGPGIPETIRARIFDPFFTTKPPGIGTGLGLAIVLGIVREHGGHVQVSSPPEGGAVFTLEFPSVSQTRLVYPLVAPATGPGEGGSGFRQRSEPVTTQPPVAELSAWSGTHVLVVEDEPTVGRLIADVLEEAGLQVDVLLDGREALQRAAAKTYGLVICDVKMPGLAGPQIYHALVRQDGPLQARFLFVTGDVAGPQTHQFLERYRLPHLAKPFRVEELIEKVRDVLRKSSGQDLALVRAGNAART